MQILLNSARFEICSLFIGAVFVFHMNRMRINGEYKQYKITSIICLILLVSVALYLFYIFAQIVRGTSDRTIIEYITGYSGTPIPNFDLFVKERNMGAYSYPGETFWALLQWFRRRGLDNIPQISLHKEFRTLNGYGTGNTYTAFRDYYHDFGILGILVLHSIFSIFFSSIYEMCTFCL